MIIAIDGPAGAGKSTTARQVAAALGFAYVDTGAMYRAIALATQERQLNPEKDETEIAALAANLPLHFAAGGTRLLIGERDVSKEIRTPAISLLASVVSAYPSVREVVTARQRELARSAESECGGAVLEGRDIQTVVFPDAAVKVFLTASTAIRARRRRDQLQEAGKEVALDVVESEVRERDERDLTRSNAPLLAAPDAVHLSTDDLTPDEVVAAIVLRARQYSPTG